MKLYVKKTRFKAPRELAYTDNGPYNDYYCIYILFPQGVYNGKLEEQEYILSTSHFKNGKAAKDILKSLGGASTVGFLFYKKEQADAALVAVKLLETK